MDKEVNNETMSSYEGDVGGDSSRFEVKPYESQVD